MRPLQIATKQSPASARARVLIRARAMHAERRKPFERAMQQTRERFPRIAARIEAPQHEPANAGPNARDGLGGMPRSARNRHDVSRDCDEPSLEARVWGHKKKSRKKRGFSSQ